MLKLGSNLFDQNLDEVLFWEEDFFGGFIEKFKGDLVFDSSCIFIEEEILKQNLKQIFKYIFMFRIVEGVDKHFEATVEKMMIFVFRRIFMGAFEDIHDKLMDGIKVLFAVDLWELVLDEGVHEIDEEGEEQFAGRFFIQELWV